MPGEEQNLFCKHLHQQVRNCMQRSWGFMETGRAKSLKYPGTECH